MDNPILEALARSLRSNVDMGVGLGETAATLGTGMGAQVLGGIHGYSRTVADLLRGKSKDEAIARGADAVRNTTERFTYQPRTSVGQRAVENVGKGIGVVADPIMKYGVDPIGERSPLAGAAILAGAELIGPKGKPKGVPKVKPHATPEIVARNEAPRYDPGSPQQLIPGIEPHSLEDAHGLALRNYINARDRMSFEDRNRGTRFDYNPHADSGQGAFYPEMREPAEGETFAGKRPTNRIAARTVYQQELDNPSHRTGETEPRMRGNTVQEQVGPENYQRMLEKSESLRDAEGSVIERGEEMYNARTRDLTQQIARMRALRAEPGISDAQRLGIEEEILRMQRSAPINVGGRISLADPGEGILSGIDYADLFGRDITREARAYHDMNPHLLRQQERIVRQLRGDPEPSMRRHPSEPEGFLADIPDRDPDAMNREAVDAFIAEARKNPELLQYGLMPPSSVRTLDDFAEHFSRQSGEDLDVYWDRGNDGDEPYYIKEEKTHGRGEMMRDTYGEYKLAEAEGGETKYDDYGNPKVFEKEKELTGPPPEGEDVLMGRKEIEKEHERGDYYRDDSGEWVYAKSRGGEPVRDERGRAKYEEVENPDYTDNEYDKATLRGKGGEIEISYGDPAMIHATEAGGKGGGQLLYQTALAHAARNGIDIGSAGLTEINAYRLLGNTLSNIVRSGVNPRDLSGTHSGRASRAPRIGAEGPEVWRAEAEEGMARLREIGMDPDRVRFDPDKGFSIDGSAATPEDIRKNIMDLSPHVGKGHGTGGVGQKSLMRNAVFQWLRTASPEDAQRVALKWPKAWGPIFAGLGAAAVGVNALRESDDAEEKYD